MTFIYSKCILNMHWDNLINMDRFLIELVLFWCVSLNIVYIEIIMEIVKWDFFLSVIVN